MGLNAGFEYREQVDGEGRGQTVLAQMTRRHRHSDETRWRARIDAGEVKVDGQVARPTQVLEAGQWLTWLRPPWTEPDVPLELAILHRDEHLLVVSKPSGLPTMPGGGFLENTLLAVARRDDPAWSPVHRLGRGTSGLVVLARTALARRALARDFRDGLLEKRYLALVEGVPAQAHFTVEVPIGEVAYPTLGTLHAAHPQGRPARSVATVLERRGAEATLVEVRIHTGKPHQIRIHMAAAGHPLVGDPLYGPGGGPRPDVTALPGDLGYHLHAWRLGLTHPATSAPLDFESHPPPLLCLIPAPYCAPQIRKLPPP